MGKNKEVAPVSFAESITGKMPEWNKNDNGLMDTYGLSCCPGFKAECLPVDTKSVEFTIVGPGDVFRTDEGKTATVIKADAEQRAILFCVKKGKRNTYMAVSIDFVAKNYKMMRSHNGAHNF